MNARCEKFFKQAYEFKPERFLKTASDTEFVLPIYLFNNFYEYLLKLFFIIKIKQKESKTTLIFLLDWGPEIVLVKILPRYFIS